MEHLGLSYKLFVRLRLHICTYDISIVVLTYFCFLLSEQHQRLGFGYDNEADQSDDSVCTLAFPAFSEDLPNNSTQHCDSNEWEYIECVFWHSSWWYLAATADPDEDGSDALIDCNVEPDADAGSDTETGAWQFWPLRSTVILSQKLTILSPTQELTILSPTQMKVKTSSLHLGPIGTQNLSHIKSMFSNMVTRCTVASKRRIRGRMWTLSSFRHRISPIRYANCPAASLQAARPWVPEKPRDRETPSELIDPELIEGFSGQKALEAWEALGACMALQGLMT